MGQEGAGFREYHLGSEFRVQGVLFQNYVASNLVHDRILLFGHGFCEALGFETLSFCTPRSQVKGV